MKTKMMKSKVLAMGVIVVLLAIGSAAQANITIDTVAVGNAGNAADTREMDDGTTNYGAVGYAYIIGKYEVTAGQYTAFLNAVAATDPYGLYNTSMTSTYGCNIQRSGTSGGYTYSVASDWANRPVNYVSWGDSARFSNWLHNGQPTGAQGLSTTEDGAYYLNGATSNSALLAVSREADWKWALTSEDEWYKAAYYKGGSTSADYWLYPTQSNTAPSNVGSDGYTDPGNHANFWNSDPPDYWGYTIGSPYYRTNVGEFENSASAYGTFDQGGNVYEWNEAIRNDSSCRGLRGGAFFDGLDAPYTLQATTRDYYWFDADQGTPTLENYDLGFRVVSLIPTAITLASFEAKAGKGKVTLKWVTATEIDNAGFNILRAESENGEYVQINKSLVPAQGTATQGSSYMFVDTEAANRMTYYYKLEDIDLNGTATMHGPVNATPRWFNRSN
jgi:formylglycine-generating enzyme required for sulfatase activity